MIIRIFFLLIGVSLGGHTAAAAQKLNVCTNTYALCSAADCQPIPGMPDKALCSCSIWEGKNVGYSSCSERTERKTKENLTALVSTFSFGGGHYKYMTCPSGFAWANCLDHPCLINDSSADKRRASCTCDIVRSQSYVTFAGECKNKNCGKAIWSGASVADNQKFMDELSKVMPAIKPADAACPGQ